MAGSEYGRSCGFGESCHLSEDWKHTQESGQNTVASFAQVQEDPAVHSDLAHDTVGRRRNQVLCRQEHGQTEGFERGTSE